jgi:hypothetical protein
MDIHVQKNETRPVFLTSYKNQLKIDQRLNFKIENSETTRKKHRGSISGRWNRLEVFGLDSKSTGNKTKSTHMELHQIKSFGTAINRQKRQTIAWVKIITKYISDEGFISRKCKDSLYMRNM